MLRLGVDNDPSPGFGDEDVVGERIDRYAMGLLHRREILNPGVSRDIDDREHRAGRVGEGSQVKALVAPVVPHLVATARLQNGCLDLTIQGTDDHWMPQAAQEQFLGGGIERDAARVAGRGGIP